MTGCSQLGERPGTYNHGCHLKDAPLQKMKRTMITVTQKPAPAVGSNLKVRASGVRNQPHRIKAAIHTWGKAKGQIRAQGADCEGLSVWGGSQRMRRLSITHGEGQVEKLPPSRSLPDLETISVRKSDAALESNQFAKIDDGQLPGKAVEFSAAGNRRPPLCKRVGRNAALFRTDSRFRLIGLARFKLTLSHARRILKLLQGQRAASGLRVIAPGRKLTNLKRLPAQGNTSQSGGGAATMTTAP